MQVKLSSAFRIIGPRVRDIAEGVHGQRVRAATKAPHRVIPDGCRTVGIVGVDHEREFSIKQDKKCAEPGGGP